MLQPGEPGLEAWTGRHGCAGRDSGLRRRDCHENVCGEQGEATDVHQGLRKTCPQGGGSGSQKQDGVEEPVKGSVDRVTVALWPERVRSMAAGLNQRLSW